MKWLHFIGRTKHLLVGTKHVDKSLGFAVEWNYLLRYAIALPNNSTACGSISQYWRKDLNAGIFITVFWMLVLFLG